MTDHSEHMPDEHNSDLKNDHHPELMGEWELIDDEFESSPTHVALLPTGKIFAYGGSSLDPEAFESPPPAEILDVNTKKTRQISMEGVNGDIWCGGYTFCRTETSSIRGYITPITSFRGVFPLRD